MFAKEAIKLIQELDQSEEIKPFNVSIKIVKQKNIVKANDIVDKDNYFLF